MYCVVKKLQKVKAGLKILNLDKYSRLRERVEEASQNLSIVQLALDGIELILHFRKQKM